MPVNDASTPPRGRFFNRAERDGAVRAMTDDGAFRVIAIETSATVRGAVASQRVTGATGATARLFADLVTGAVLVRETMAPTLRVQGILKGGGGRGSLVADSQPDGTTRGLVQLKKADHIDVATGAVLQMMRTLPNGALHHGIVELPTDGNLSSGLMAYMEQSEQVVSVIAVGALPGETDQSFDLAGGYIVQLLPDADPAAVQEMIEKLEALPPMNELLAREGFSAHALLDWVLLGSPYSIVEERPVSFGCNCSHERLLASLSTLDRGEIVAMVDEAKVLEITCDYCQSEYRISPEQLRGLLAPS
jgi:molecular chaperone Hsp33